MAKIKKSNSKYEKKSIVIAKSNDKERVTIALPNSKHFYSPEIISVPQYRKMAQSELLLDEVIIKNLVERKTSQALWEKIIKKIKKICCSDKKDLSKHSVIVKSIC